MRVTPSPNAAHYQDPRGGIQRDEAYRTKACQDHRRYRMRRWVHALSCFYEKLIRVPRWQGLAGQARPSLSVCIITMDSGHRIGPLLRHLRTWLQPGDEIVVGIDSKTTDHTWDVCEPLVDTVFTIENNALTCNGGLGELVGRCQGNWVLRLDDDEFPEPHFFQWLPGFLNQDRITHYKLPRLHLSALAYDQEQSPTLWWVPDGYLYPDFQMRLFKNDPALLTFPQAVGHASIGCQGARGRINSVNLVHLNLAINPRWRREAKLRNYIKRLDGGWVHPVNEYALLFEDFNYQCQRYTYPDRQFQQQLAETITAQRTEYGETPPSVG